MLQKFADSANLKVLELSSAGGQLNALADIMAKTLVNIPLVGNMASIILQNIAHCLLKRFLYNPTTNYPLMYFVILQKE
jgi:hypothetical protein